MSNIKKIKRADELIAEFQNSFYKELQIFPLVSYDVGFLSKSSLSDIEDAINKAFRDNYPEAYPIQGIRSKSRFAMVITYRFIFFNIAREKGYTFKVIGKYLGFNHATVLHGSNNVKNLLGVKDPIMIQHYNLAQNEVQSRVINTAAVCYDEQQGVNA